jgi:hypothetical protein
MYRGKFAEEITDGATFYSRRLTTKLYLKLVYIFLLTFVLVIVARYLIEIDLPANSKSMLILLGLWLVVSINSVCDSETLVKYAFPGDRKHYYSVAKKNKEMEEQSFRKYSLDKSADGFTFDEDEDLDRTLREERDNLVGAIKAAPYLFALAQYSAVLCISVFIYGQQPISQASGPIIYYGSALLLYGTLIMSIFVSLLVVRHIWVNGKRFRISGNF